MVVKWIQVLESLYLNCTIFYFTVGGDNYPHGASSSAVDGPPVFIQDLSERTEHHGPVLPVLRAPIPESRGQPVQHGHHIR